MIDRMDDWTRSLVAEEAFAEEQARLSGVWTFIGLASDLSGPDAWITGRIGGRPVFVQRFDDGLRGFENLCAHRGFPLRVGEAGQGPVVCGFHHWRYNAEGEAVGVPVARDVYGCTADALAARLEPVEVACCGELVFGRFANEAAEGLLGGDLETFLGEAFPILERLSDQSAAPRVHSYGRAVAANWKLMTAITLDDYHLPAVHGWRRYLARDSLDYWRIGPHSAHSAGREETLQAMRAGCEAGEFKPKHYKIFNIFPNLAVILFYGGLHWHVMVMRFDAEGPALTRWSGQYFRTPWNNPLKILGAQFSPPVPDRIVFWFVRRIVGKIIEEDHVACELWQTAARQASEPGPLLSALETRVGWFAETWRAAMASGRLTSGEPRPDNGRGGPPA